jgi:phosphoribosylformylglycinamidine (FGAM) synthase-like amidotransferase family enzyme
MNFPRLEKGSYRLGLENGVPVLARAGLLPRSHGGRPQLVTLAGNDSGKFECRLIYLRDNETSSCILTRGIDLMYPAVTHREGKMVLAPGH